MRYLTPALLVVLALSSGCSLVRMAARQSKRHPGTDEGSMHPLQYDGPDVSARSNHPRLMITQMPAEDETLAAWRRKLLARGSDVLRQPPIAYSSKALLTRSRDAMQRISLLAGLYQVTREQQWADGARAELLNVCRFRDWQPNDFLATAEMMCAVAIGYDWIYDTLSPQDRDLIQSALITKGLNPALSAYSSRGGWTTAHHNWNLVCNGGVIVACLAIVDEQPVPAQRCLSYAMNSIKSGLAAYDPQGGTAEGPMYHNYATRYLTFAAASLQTAPQTPVRLEQIDRDWTRAGDFRVAMSGPSGKVANFGDCSDVVGNSAWMFWHAREFRRPDYAAFEAAQDNASPSMFDYLWYTASANASGRAREPDLALAFGAAVTLRSSWSPTGTFVAVRTGSTAGNHSHLDLGSFVLDMQGQRFAADLGADNYDMPGYLNDRRAEYLRSSTPGHNTLSIANASQPLDATATAEILRGNGRSIARVDLTGAYPHADQVTREIGVDASGAVGITDTIRLQDRAPIVWNLHTPARVSPMRGGAVLEAGGKRVQLRILEPANAKLTVIPDETEPPALPIENSTHIRITLPAAEQMRLKIEFVAVGS